MPIFEYACINCKHKIEKITLAKVKPETVPQQVAQSCVGKCGGAITRHTRVVSKPAYVGLTPPGTAKKVATMAQMRKPKDPAWKQRVKQGLNPDGRPLTNMKQLNAQEWEEQVQTAFPDLAEQQREVVGRARAGELGTAARSIEAFKDATHG